MTRMGRKTKDFNDDLVKLLRYEGGTMTFYRDSKCEWLYVGVSEYGKRSFYFIDSKGNGKFKRYKKLVGDVYEINLEQARKIVLNIADNLQEFYRTTFTDRLPLCRDFAQNGFLPRKQPELPLEKNAQKPSINLEYQQKIKAQNEKLTDLLKAIDNRVKRFSERLSAVLDEYKI